MWWGELCDAKAVVSLCLGFVGEEKKKCYVNVAQTVSANSVYQGY